MLYRILSKHLYNGTELVDTLVIEQYIHTATGLKFCPWRNVWVGQGHFSPFFLFLSKPEWISVTRDAGSLYINVMKFFPWHRIPVSFSLGRDHTSIYWYLTFSVGNDLRTKEYLCPGKFHSALLEAFNVEPLFFHFSQFPHTGKSAGNMP